MIKSAMSGVPVTLQNAATTGNGIQIAIPPGFKYHQIIIKGTNGISAGAIQPECGLNADSTDAADWAPVGGGPIAIVDNDSVEFNWQGSYTAFRSRISTDVVGGTVMVKYTGHS